MWENNFKGKLLVNSCRRIAYIKKKSSGGTAGDTVVKNRCSRTNMTGTAAIE